ncbi:MAG: histidine kinase [Rhizobacter sp.]|nr:histidine kinase [Ferruginibacter sp.]
MNVFIYNKKFTRYWLKVFALYAITEAVIQLLFFFILNNFSVARISIIEYHFVMWVFQCVLILPIWLVAARALKQNTLTQLILNLLFYIGYTWCWFGPVQYAIAEVYNAVQEITRPLADRQLANLDKGDEYAFLNYQLIKHAFRLLWFYMAAFFYNYQVEETKKMELALANKALQLKMLTWHLNPSFYFKTIANLRSIANERPEKATQPILQLAKVMEYVIYETREKLIAVDKEIRFMHSYLNLLNQQEGTIPMELNITGDYSRLKIYPLLLNKIADSIIAANVGTNRVVISIDFAGNEMCVQTSLQKTQQQTSFATLQKELDNILGELYPQQGSIEIKDHRLLLFIKLYEYK